MVGSQSALAVVDAGTEARAIVTYSGVVRRVGHEADVAVAASGAVELRPVQADKPEPTR